MFFFSLSFLTGGQCEGKNEVPTINIKYYKGYYYYYYTISFKNL